MFVGEQEPKVHCSLRGVNGADQCRSVAQRGRLSPRLYLGVERGWRLGEISEKSRTQPSLQVQVSRVIPISTTFCPPPIEPILMTGKRRTGEDQRESVLRVGDVSNDTIDPGVGSRNEGLLGQADASIIEDPHAMVLVRRNYINCIHAVGRAVSPYLVLRPDGQQQCVLFAFCCSKDESGRTSVRPLSEIKTLRCSKRSSRFRFR